MKKHYITPTVKSVNVVAIESVMVTGSLGGETDEQGTKGHRDSRGSWGNLWDGGEEE